MPALIPLPLRAEESGELSAQEFDATRSAAIRACRRRRFDVLRRSSLSNIPGRQLHPRPVVNDQGNQNDSETDDSR
jgi:hypothetical protein